MFQTDGWVFPVDTYRSLMIKNYRCHNIDGTECDTAMLLIGTLALPKLNLQFLTVHDYLLRNFQLFRLESTCEFSVKFVHIETLSLTLIAMLQSTFAVFQSWISAG